MKKNKPDLKIHALLAQQGLGSRRQIEGWIQQNQIKVNGQYAHIGQRVCEKDKIEVRGKQISLQSSKKQDIQVLAYYKPTGEICSRGQSKFPTIYENLPEVEGKWVSVGRLDVNTSGLILLTNYGDLAHRLMHPSFEIIRKYRVRAFGELNEKAQKRLCQGVKVEDDFLKVHSIKPLYSTATQVKNQWYELILKEGKYREIRRLFESQGTTVSRLIRVGYGPIELFKELKPGRYQMLNQNQVKKLLASVKL